jgi:hypothetical protein
MSAFIANGNHVEVVVVLGWLWILRWCSQAHRVRYRSIPLQIFRAVVKLVLALSAKATSMREI